MKLLKYFEDLSKIFICKWKHLTAIFNHLIKIKVETLNFRLKKVYTLFTQSCSLSATFGTLQTSNHSSSIPNHRPIQYILLDRSAVGYFRRNPVFFFARQNDTVALPGGVWGRSSGVVAGAEDRASQRSGHEIIGSTQDRERSGDCEDFGMYDVGDSVVECWEYR